MDPEHDTHSIMLLTRSYWYAFFWGPYLLVTLNLYMTLWLFLYQRAGAVFPQRSERSAPVFTPPQTQPLSNYPPNLRNPELPQESGEASAEDEYPSLKYIF